MQIFIYEDRQKIKVTEFMDVSFSENILRVELERKEVITVPAKVGDSFYITPNGRKVPRFEKVVFPEKRGEKIAWCLSFIGEKKLANSYEDFYQKLDKKLQEDSHRLGYACDKGNYGIAFDFSQAPNKIKPALCFVDDNIDKDTLRSLYYVYLGFRRNSYCPEEFFMLL